jgi:hypothetical protein
MQKQAPNREHTAHRGPEPTNSHAGEVGGQQDDYDSRRAEYPEGFQIIDYNEQEEIVTIELHRHLLQHPQQREAILKKFVEILEHGPNLKGSETVELSFATALGPRLRLKATPLAIPVDKLDASNND